MLTDDPFSKRTQIRIPAEQLDIGMFVAELDRPWIETPFVFQGFRVKTDRELETLWDFCDYVYVDLEKGAVPGAMSELQPRVSRRRFRAIHRRLCSQPYETKHPIRTPVEQELPEALSLHKGTREHVFEMFHDAKTKNRLHLDRSKQVVQSLVNSVMRNPDAITWASRLRSRDAYTAEHSLNVAILSIGFGRYLGMSALGLVELGLGAMLHDIGKLRVPLDVLNKPGQLTRDEFNLMKQHPLHGLKILSSSGALSDVVMDVAHSHHERMDGRGYPRRLPPTDISFYARLVAIADVYDALTSDRIYRDALPVMECLYKLYEWGQRDLDGKLVLKFIRSLGAFPVGSRVELSDGSEGTIVGLNRLNPRRSKVQLSRDLHGVVLSAGPIVDLSGRSELVIKGLANDKFGEDEMTCDAIDRVAQRQLL